MKKLLVIASFLLVCGMANAQADWNTMGNSFTSTTPYPYLGTNSPHHLLFKTNTIERARITDAGDMGLGVITPAAKLDIWKQIPSVSGSYYGIKTELITATMPQFTWANSTAISGKALTYDIGFGIQVGVYGEGVDGQVNYGGHFYGMGSDVGTRPVNFNYGVDAGALGDPAVGNCGGRFQAVGSGGYNTGAEGNARGNPSGQNIGVFGNASGDPGGRNIGVFGIATGNPVTGAGNIGGYFQYGLSSNPANDWAVWSQGDSWAAGGTWQPSDRNLKDNIKPFTNAIEKIMLLKPSTYTYRREEFKDMNLPAGEQTGLIAQELQAVFPEFTRNVGKMVIQNAKGEASVSIPEHTSVNYISLIPVLISGVQEQQKEIEDLKARLAAFENPMVNTSPSNTDGFVLEQNMPNPFSGETRINYSLPSQIKNASLLVYDLTGKQISSFPLSAKESSITITSEKLSAGIYIYSVMADGKIMDSKRMVVAAKH